MEGQLHVHAGRSPDGQESFSSEAAGIQPISLGWCTIPFSAPYLGAQHMEHHLPGLVLLSAATHLMGISCSHHCTQQ